MPTRSDGPEFEPHTAIIPAHSERQALDWSLVLASQDIASSLERSAENGRWYLALAIQDRDRALAAIRQYRLENRRWAWRQKLTWSGVMFHWGVLVWCIGLVCFPVLELVHGIDLHVLGRMDSVAARSGQWWRLFTAICLHADGGHLAANLAIGFIFLGLAMGRFGAGCGLLAAYLAGVAGNVLWLWSCPRPCFSLGASGMVMGGLGLVAVQSLSLWRENPRAVRYILSGILTGVMLFVLFGLDPGSNVVAHLGGFLAGGLLGGLLALLPNGVVQGIWANILAATLLSGTVLGTWRLALRP
jgi:membrane associated rhomboid family serine protease